MKTMTCRQLSGACEKEFHDNTFEEMAQMSKKHAMEMFQIGDEDHIRAMNKMRELMQSPEATKEWFENMKREFHAFPDNE